MVSRRFLDLRKLCEVTRPRITTFSPSGMLEMEMMSPAVSYRKGRWHSRSPRDTMPSSFNFAAVAGPTPFEIVTGSARTAGSMARLEVGGNRSSSGLLVCADPRGKWIPVSYTHLRAHETKANLV